ncbi:MAG: sugar-transfer associated ATP-grasp domain-containing protein [Bacteroidales bacterium]
MLRLMGKAWNALPWDGQGWRAPADRDLADLRRAAAARFWRRLPWWSRLALAPAGRLLWPLAAAMRTACFTRARLPAPAGGRVFADCVLGGARPVDAWAWRALVAATPHPLPARSAAAVLTGLGDPAAHALLRDKLATARLLDGAAILTPTTLAQLPPDTAPDRRQPPWNAPAALFIKPRTGYGGRGTMAVDVLPGGNCRLPDGTVVDVEQLRGDREMLVQARLAAAAELADLAAAGPAPVLRLTTARAPGEVPFLHSALLSVAVPGRRPEAFLRGHLWAAVEPASATLTAGVILAEPARRHAHLPWNGAPLAGRALPGFAAAAELALRAMTLLPGLPLATWDVILTADGPVFLEGNSAGNWVLTNLPEACGLALPPLPPVLRKWIAD